MMKFLDVLHVCLFDYTRSLTDPWVMSTAKEIADRTYKKDKTRSWQQIYDDSLNGVALQDQVYRTLKLAGVNVEMEMNRKEWDLKIHEGGATYYADVKGIFKEGTKNWTLTWWEASNVPSAGVKVIYLCFDARTQIFEGWCEFKDFSPSKLGTPPYVPKNKLNFL